MKTIDEKELAKVLAINEIKDAFMRGDYCELGCFELESDLFLDKEENEVKPILKAEFDNWYNYFLEMIDFIGNK